MPWRNSPEDRRRSSETYDDPVYRRNAAICKERAGGRCQECGRRTRRLAADHITPRSQGGTHDLSNLQALCTGPGSCHARKTATEGGGYRSTSPANPEPRSTWTRW
jgi:5-methylcytosine-specific restriction protein A